MRLAMIISAVLLSTPVLAADTITFQLKDWQQALVKIEHDQAENKLLRQQNGELKQLVTLTEKQLEECEKLLTAQQDLLKLADEHQRVLDSKIGRLQAEADTVPFWKRASAAEGVIIIGLLGWILW